MPTTLGSFLEAHALVRQKIKINNAKCRCEARSNNRQFNDKEIFIDPKKENTSAKVSDILGRTLQISEKA